MGVNLKRIKAERVARGLTQDEMARKLGWTDRARYAKRENGIVPMSVDDLAKITTAFGMSVNDVSIFFTQNVPKKEQKEA